RRCRLARTARPSTGSPMLADVLEFLRCPLCAGNLAGERRLICSSGHGFDVARQGYVNLLVGDPPAGTDTADMIQARLRVLAAGLLAGLTAAVVDAAGAARPGLIIDAGAGTGHHLAAALDNLGGVGLALDIAKPAVRRAARAHPRIGAAVCDVWRG